MKNNRRWQRTLEAERVMQTVKRFRRWLGAFAIAALWVGLFLASAAPSQGGANGGAVVWLDASAPHLAHQPFTVTVMISDVANLNGAEMALRFSPDSAAVLDADPGSAGVQIAPGSCPQTDFVVANSVDNGTGRVLYAVTQMYPTQPFTGSCDFAHVIVRPSRPGELAFTFENLKLADAQGQRIASQVQGLTLTVGAGSLDIHLPLVMLGRAP